MRSVGVASEKPLVREAGSANVSDSAAVIYLSRMLRLWIRKDWGQDIRKHLLCQPYQYRDVDDCRGVTMTSSPMYNNNSFDFTTKYPAPRNEDSQSNGRGETLGVYVTSASA